MARHAAVQHQELQSVRLFLPIPVLQVERLEKQISGLQLQLRQQQAQTSAQGSPAAGSPAQGAAGGAGSEEGSEAGSEAGSADAAAASAAAAAAAMAAAEERAAAAERLAGELRRQLVEQRDRADAFEELLKQQATAAAAAAATAVQASGGGAAGASGSGAEEAAADDAAMAAAQTPGAAGATPVSKAGATPGGAAAAAVTAPVSPPFPGFAAAGTPLPGGLPSAAFLAASPVLSASRAVAEWMVDADAAEAATPAGQPLPLLQLLPGAADIVCERESHMEAEQLRALKVSGVWQQLAVQAGLGLGSSMPSECSCSLALLDMLLHALMIGLLPISFAGQGGAHAGCRSRGRRPYPGQGVWGGGWVAGGWIIERSAGLLTSAMVGELGL